MKPSYVILESRVRHRDTYKKSSQRQALKNLSAVLGSAGSSLRNVVKVNIFLTTMDDFAAMNEAYDEFFTWEPKPVSVHVPWICLYPRADQPASLVSNLRGCLSTSLPHGCRDRVYSFRRY